MADDNAYYHPAAECFQFNDYYVQFPEVICHEFTHAVVKSMNDRIGSEGMGGAINEAIADVVGVVFKHWSGSDALPNSKGPWCIGDRNLSEEFTRADLIEDYVPKYDSKGKTTNDYGHDHRNSRLLSYAFRFASHDLGDDLVHEQQLLKIWWKTVETLEVITFKDFAKKTMKVANTHEFGLLYKEAIEKAWQAVGFKFQ